MIYTVRQAKAQLSRLIAAALEGDEVIIARGGKPVVRLLPIVTAGRSPRFGAMKGELTLTEAFFEPLPDEEFALCDGDAG